MTAIPSSSSERSILFSGFANRMSRPSTSRIQTRVGGTGLTALRGGSDVVSTATLLIRVYAIWERDRIILWSILLLWFCWVCCSPPPVAFDHPILNPQFLSGQSPEGNPNYLPWCRKPHWDVPALYRRMSVCEISSYGSLTNRLSQGISRDRRITHMRGASDRISFRQISARCGPVSSSST